MNLHHPAHETILQELLTGDRDVTDEPVRLQLERCAECRIRWEEFQQVQALVVATQRPPKRSSTKQRPPSSARWGPGLEQEAGEWGDRAAASSLPPSSQEDEVLRKFSLAARSLAAKETPDRKTREWGVLVALAAAIAIVALVLEVPRTVVSTPLPRVLGDATLRCVHPIGDVESFEFFEWEESLSEELTFDLSIYDADHQLVLHRASLSAPRWAPNADERRRLPEVLEWEVVARDATAAEYGVARARARKTSP